MPSTQRLLEIDQAHMIAACAYGMLSRAVRAKVGSIIVKDGAVISFGWNGTPEGWDNACEGPDGRTLDDVIHAERNALAKVGRRGAEGGALYCLYSPCKQCAIDIITHRITEDVYLIDYRGADGRAALEKSKIPTRRLSADFARRLEMMFGMKFNWEDDDRRCCPHGHAPGAPCA